MRGSGKTAMSFSTRIGAMNARARGTSPLRNSLIISITGGARYPEPGSWRASTFFDAHWDHEPYSGRDGAPPPSAQRNGRTVHSVALRHRGRGRRRSAVPTLTGFRESGHVVRTRVGTMNRGLGALIFLVFPNAVAQGTLL